MRIKANLFAYSIFSAAFVVPAFIHSAPTSKETSKEHSAYHEITTSDLKEAIDSKKPAIILDARKKLSGGLLPGAKQLPYDADAKEIAKVLGSLPKDAMIVVYCANKDCPVSAYLAESLVSAGYTNVYKYPAGVAGWMKKNYPVDKI